MSALGNAFEQLELYFATRISSLVGQFINPELEAIRTQLATLSKKADAIMASQADVKAKLDALSANVADEKTVIGSVETLLSNLQQQIRDLQTKITNADVPQEIVDAVDALSQAVTDNKTQLANDVAANTPAASTQ